MDMDAIGVSFQEAVRRQYARESKERGQGPAEANAVSEGVEQEGSAKSSVTTPAPTRQATVSNELRGLLVQYAASCLDAIERTEVNWSALAKRLGTRVEFIAQAAEVADKDGSLWLEVLQERIRRVGATRAFRDVTWERVESRALKMIDLLLEKNLIRDSGELLAIANQARKVNDPQPSGGTNLNINLNQGDGDMGQDLPGAGAKLTIDLSPRIAANLQTRERAVREERVIDGQMLTAKELRAGYENHATEKESGDE